MRDGRVRRAWIGIAGGTRPLPPRVAARVGRDRGVEVVEVAADSPAAAAGLRAEDLVVAIDEVPVRGVDDMHRLLTAEHIGRRTELTVMRAGAERRLRITPRELGLGRVGRGRSLRLGRRRERHALDHAHAALVARPTRAWTG